MGRIKIYIDILVITNSIITMLCVQLTAKLCHRKLKGIRLFFSSAAGGITSLLMIFNSAGYGQSFFLTVLKILSFPAIVLIAMPVKSLKELLRRTTIFFIINLFYAGLTLLIWQLSDSKIIFVRNYTVYFNISLLSLVISVTVCYILISAYERLKRKMSDRTLQYCATYRCGNYQLTIPAVSDTGNKLCDSFTGTPVVVFYCDDLYFHYNLDSFGNELIRGFTLVPFNTVNGGGVIPITTMGTVDIQNDKETYSSLKCCVGIVRSDKNKSKAIFNPYILR